MQTRTFRQAFDAALLDLLWSLWAELGVAGWTRRHQRWVIDPEPVILLTAACSHRDPRLRDEALDWCVRFGRYVSLARLRNMVKEPSSEGAAPDLRAALGPFAATVNAHSSQRWPFATNVLAFVPSGKSRLAPFERPALLALRLRAFLGVSARAEVLRILLLTPGEQLTAAELVEREAGYTKRALRDALQDLHMGGALQAIPSRNTVAYRLRSDVQTIRLDPRSSLAEGAGGPIRWLELARILCTLAGVVEGLPAVASLSETLEVRRALRSVELALRRAHLPDAPREVTGAAFLPAFERWALGMVRSLAQGDRLPPLGTRRGDRR